MPRRATGQVMTRTRADGTVYALRFNANGRRQYVTLGSSLDGWTQAKAQDQLEHELALVRADAWTEPTPEPVPEVDRYAAAKRKQGTLSPASINKTVALLAQVLDVAVEYPADTTPGDPRNAHARGATDRRADGVALARRGPSRRTDNGPAGLDGRRRPAYRPAPRVAG